MMQFLLFKGNLVHRQYCLLPAPRHLLKNYYKCLAIGELPTLVCCAARVNNCTFSLDKMIQTEASCLKEM